MNINKNCPCPKLKCSLHGKCKECMEKHKDGFPACKNIEKLTLIK